MNHQGVTQGKAYVFGLFHLLFAGVATCGLLVATFLYGFSSGRTQATERLLSEQLQFAARLPAVESLDSRLASNTMARSADIGGGVIEGSGGLGSDMRESVSGEGAAAGSDANGSSTGGTSDRMDFIAMNTLPQIERAQIEKPQIEKAQIEKPQRTMEETSEDKLPVKGSASEKQPDREVNAVVVAANNQKEEPAKEVALKEGSAKANALREETAKRARLAEPETFVSEKKAVIKSETAPPPVAPKKPEKTGASGGWHVQVVASPTRSEALRVAQSLSGNGSNARVERALVGGKEFFRVVVGPYSNRTEADSAKNRIRSQMGGKSTPFVRFIED